MSEKKLVNIPFNRVEGDLEIRVEMDGGVVSDAWCSGTMYRGFEKILIGRGALDGLVITPRICGICSTAHLTAAALALDMVAGINPPPDATRIRNIVLMTEHIQSDIRHAFLMFAPDFLNTIHKDCVLYDEAGYRYEPFKGKTSVEVIKETKNVLEIIAIIGGQWPHSSYMVPGGIVSVPSVSDLMQCQLILRKYRQWYERKILGCTIERWESIKNAADLQTWLEESKEHWKSDLGFFIRFARAVGLDKIGRGHGSFIAYGYPGSKEIEQSQSIPSAGFATIKEKYIFDQSKIAEEVDYSWFQDYKDGKHPFEGETHPYASGKEGKKYSWGKAPRYDGFPVETGPMAEMIINQSPLFTDIMTRNGPSAFLREMARLVRPTILIPIMEKYLEETVGDGKFYIAPESIIEGRGFGLTQAGRGCLGHWVEITNGSISHYQIITPTAWNASPRDSKGIRGPIEEALTGTEVKDIENPVELGHIIRSFDPCLVCTVHAVKKGQTSEPFRWRLTL